MPWIGVGGVARFVPAGGGLMSQKSWSHKVTHHHGRADPSLNGTLTHEKARNHSEQCMYNV